MRGACKEPSRMTVAERELYCKDCRYWYGAEDDEYGPCQIKQARGDRRFVTFGGHVCDEPLARKEYGVDE